jgi:hypothetical protein
MTLSNSVEFLNESLLNRLIPLDILQYCGMNYSYQHSLSIIRNPMPKFELFKKILDCPDEELKNDLLKQHSRFRKNLNSINRVIVYYKYKTYKPLVSNDLFGNRIDISSKSIFQLTQNGQKYLLTVGDLTKIIDNALSHSPNFIATPLCIKNPYNNLPLEKHHLYNIYFFIKSGEFKLSSLFHNFFLCEFNLKKFRNKNLHLIREVCIKNYIKNASINDLYNISLKILSRKYGQYSLSICPDFRKDRLIQIMKPYIYLYLEKKLSIDENIKQNAGHELNYRMKNFASFNPKFGRKSIIFNIGEEPTTVFNEFHIGFNNLIEYSNSHVEIIEDNYYSDEVMDSDDDEFM